MSCHSFGYSAKKLYNNTNVEEQIHKKRDSGD